jgi:hypothetical protein
MKQFEKAVLSIRISTSGLTDSSVEVADVKNLTKGRNNNILIFVEAVSPTSQTLTILNSEL